MKRFSGFILLAGFLTSFLYAPVSETRQCPAGHRWIRGHKAPNGIWIAGYCKPIEDKTQCPIGQTWIPGHKGPAGKWIPGHCK